MRIALVAEGCYPFVTGGVSTWCDQLIRGLSDHAFEVVALTATRIGRPAMELPVNVAELRQVPLWGWTPKYPAPGEAVLARVLAAYRAVLAGMLGEDGAEDFADGLRGLFEAAQQGVLGAVLQSDEALKVLTGTWRAYGPGVPLGLRDALTATELLDRMLVPLSAQVSVADVVHPVSNGLPVLTALAARWRFGTPYVISEHGVYLRERYLSAQQIGYSWPVKTFTLAFMRALCRLGYEQADVVAPVNVYNQRWEVRHGADPARILTAYNGVRPEDLPAAESDPDRPTVGWVGRVDPLKDLETLVEAFALVHARVPDAVLRLFGPTPEGNQHYAEQVRARVAEAGIEDVVTFEGPIRPVSAGYHASTVVALSSISEGLPYTVMEAMMCARATVSTAVGGVPEVAGDAGLLVPPRNPAAMADALVELLTDPARRADLAHRARDRALATFPLELMLQRFREVYQGLVRVPVPPATTAASAEVQTAPRLVPGPLALNPS